jgi:hypothetical protein
MYGPPQDCKGKLGRETSLRQCIRPLGGDRLSWLLECYGFVAQRLLIEGDIETPYIFEKDFREGISQLRQRNAKKRHPKEMSSCPIAFDL